MQKIETLTGVAAPLNIVNIDTDMIIPKQFLKTILRTGLGKSLFYEMRYTQEGVELPEFVLNNTNAMRLHHFANAARGQLVLMAIYDNLGKGASGAAVQNLNLMIGADEAESVDLVS